jgi:CDP-glucose 4,6-dehydratase
VNIPRAVAIDPDFWRGRRVLLTGHTGFKGSWLTLWLGLLGAEVTGLAEPAPAGSLYERARVGEGVTERAVDVRDARGLAQALEDAQPEVVLQLAAQPLVRRSLREPAATYEINVMGTVNVLEAVRAGSAPVASVVVVTSDKCYENTGERRRPFTEDDPLGGSDPYSSSKACAELVTAAYRRSFGDGDSARIASARAGNVIGGGDRCEDRLVPDALRAVESGEPLLVRNPTAVRPWQHVLGPLSGYLMLAERLSESQEAARPWNFGPPAEESRPVGWIAARLAELWEGELEWATDPSPQPAEAHHLLLDSTAAERELGWRPPWGLEEALARTVEWHRSERAGEDMRARSIEQIEAYTAALDG